MLRSLLLILPLLFAIAPLQPAQIQRILFAGNSITHTAPLPGDPYFWMGNQGINASAPHLDYVHQVWAGVAAQQGSVPGMVIVKVVFAEDMDLDEEIAAYQPDLVIVQWGEAAPYDMPQDWWNDIYRKIKDAAGGATVVAVGVWGTHELRDKEDKLRIAALNAGMFYAPILDLHAPRTPEMCAGLHQGICNHPNDSEMAAIAGRILAAIYSQSTYLPLVHGEGGTVPPK